jgi:hydrogenase maturation protein HypF
VHENFIVAHVIVKGTVQGVGFRPFVYSLAEELHLRGSVRNAGGAVHIQAIGPAHAIDRLLQQLQSNAPPLAIIEEITTTYGAVPDNPPDDFSVLASSQDSNGDLRVPPDIATCNDCLAEIFDETDRRYLYPFTNCTNCGPRFTVIHSLPYDRSATTMSCFPMCENCESEYRDPLNRRFHAQPTACWICGPQLFFVDAYTCAVPTVRGTDVASRQRSSMEALGQAVSSLRRGDIVAIKGLGGFHLACDAFNHKAVLSLRQRKRRNGKPFAVMFRDIQQINEHCYLSDQEEKIVTSSRRPITLLTPKPGAAQGISCEVSNGLGTLGAMLPCMPLQHILLKEFGTPLVMTSGNIHEEPIAIGNREAILKLEKTADCFLINNRDIRCRFDDSVVRVVSGSPVQIRRARGYSPECINVPIRAQHTVLALGAQLKSTFTLLSKHQAYVSQHLGDATNVDTLAFLEQTLSHYEELLALRPEVVACDLHPDYMTTQLAERLSKEWGLPLLQVQHHHAHIVSCMAENGIADPVIGVAFDGSGYGDDHTVWGGEVLVCDFKDYRRVGRLSQVPLAGGEAAVRNPWRMAASHLHNAMMKGDKHAGSVLKSLEERIGDEQVAMVLAQMKRKLNSPLTSSCGRLFDAVSSIIGLCDRADFEGQAAMLLETHASTAAGTRRLAEQRDYVSQLGDLLEIDSAAILGSVLELASSPQISLDEIAFQFHRTLADAILQTCRKVAEQTSIGNICLSGGVFQNKLLTELVTEGLKKSDLVPITQHKVPPNDGGISLGQSVVASMHFQGGGSC